MLHLSKTNMGEYRFTTPERETSTTSDEKHKPIYDTRTKAQVVGPMRALKATGNLFSKTAVYEMFGIEPRSGQNLYRALHEAQHEEDVLVRFRKRKLYEIKVLDEEEDAPCEPDSENELTE